jgi:hypothetical protein
MHYGRIIPLKYCFKGSRKLLFVTNLNFEMAPLFDKCHIPHNYVWQPTPPFTCNPSTVCLVHHWRKRAWCINGLWEVFNFPSFLISPGNDIVVHHGIFKSSLLKCIFYVLKCQIISSLLWIWFRTYVNWVPKLQKNSHISVWDADSPCPQLVLTGK